MVLKLVLSVGFQADIEEREIARIVELTGERIKVAGPKEIQGQKTINDIFITSSRYSICNTICIY
jgi:hypothetical protein